MVADDPGRKCWLRQDAHPVGARKREDMRIFSKKPTVKPTITVDGIVVSLDPKFDMWEFVYRDINFFTYKSDLHMPSDKELEGMLSDIAALEPEMVQRLEKGWSGWGDVKMNDGESYKITLDTFGGERGFGVAWSDGATWGDMEIIFWVKDHQIMDESWGD